MVKKRKIEKKMKKVDMNMGETRKTTKNNWMEMGKRGRRRWRGVRKKLTTFRNGQQLAHSSNSVHNSLESKALGVLD